MLAVSASVLTALHKNSSDSRDQDDVGFIVADAEAPVGSSFDPSPTPIPDDHFEPLDDYSPFLRSVNAADTMVMTGMAKIGSETMVSIVDTKTSKSAMVSATTNSEGWQLVKLEKDPRDSNGLIAHVKISSGEVVPIRQQEMSPQLLRANSGSMGGKTRLRKEQLKEARHAAINFRDGFSSDGFPNKPPRDIAEKLARLKTDRIESINQQMIELRNRGMGPDERKKIYVDKVNRAVGR